ncbi:MAG: SPOR domain-containing protein, partial [Acidobacteriota bacterium]
LAGTPEKGRIYIQLASVERGYAILMVYGARKLGFPSFIAPGASSAVYRVLCGPFADEEAYKEAKQTFANAGLDTFSRKYTEPAESPRPASSSCQRA